MDNLTLEGKHSMKKETAVSYVGERASVVKHEDNLKVEAGAFEGYYLKSDN